MSNLKIAIGTTSVPKIKYLEEVLNELKIKSKLFPVDIPSGVSEQPKTSRETKRGSINRASIAFKKVKEGDCGIGIEVGYHKNKNNQYEMFCWVTIFDKSGYKISSQSHKFLLPKYHQEILNKDIYLGDNLDGYIKEKNVNGNKHIRNNIDTIIRHRKPFIENALRNSLVRYIQREDFV